VAVYYLWSYKCASILSMELQVWGSILSMELQVWGSILSMELQVG